MMREIRRKNPHLKNTGDIDALDDVNEQELAKDGVGADMSDECRGSDTDVTPPTSKADANEHSATLPLCVEEKEEQIVVPPRAQEKSEDKEPKQTSRPPEPEESDEQEDAPRHRKTGGFYVAFIAICALLSVAVVLYAALGRPTEQPPQGEAQDEQQEVADNTEDNVDPRPFYDRIASSAVTVRVRTENGTRIGSGTVVFSDGYIATLWDAVENAESVEVILKSGESYQAAVVGGSSLSELALLKIEASALEALTIADGVQVGDTVYAVGAVGSSASASLSSSLCKGSVSYGVRTLRVDEKDAQKFIKAIQLDGFGNDTLGGCPVFNEDGAAIAIMVNIGSDAASFALPINEAMSVLSSIKEGETLTDEAVSALAYPCARLGAECETVDSGVRIAAFTVADSDVARKLKIGDVIVKVGESTVSEVDALKAEIEKHRVGDTVEIFVQRYGQILSFYVDLSL